MVGWLVLPGRLGRSKLQLVEPKTDRSRRRLLLPSFAGGVLREHKVRQLEERLRAGMAWQESGLVFTTAAGTPLAKESIHSPTHCHESSHAAPFRSLRGDLARPLGS